MTQKHNVLIIGAVNQLEVLAHNPDKNITFAANYEEATEPLIRATFGHVITDAVLPDDKTGLDVVRLMKQTYPNLKQICATVCHNEMTCEADNRTWNIKTSLDANFLFAEFYKGTIGEYWSDHQDSVQKCA